MIDGKEVRKYAWGRKSRIIEVRPHDGGLDRRTVIVEVEAFSKDHSFRRIKENFPNVAPNDWDFLDEYDYDCDVGVFGQKLPLFPVVAGPMRAQ